jgi:LacI family transcriptional regulator
MAMTLKDVAGALGISLSTVSRVINNRQNVNPQTREQVMAYLREHDGLDLVAARTGLEIKDVAAVVIPDISEDYFDFVVRGIEKNLWAKGCGMMLCDTMEDVEKESRFMEMLIEKNFSGIVLATVDKDERRLAKYLHADINLVFFDNLPYINENFNSVITDNMKASLLAINHLHSFGHRAIGFISGRQEETTGFERLIGYRRAMETHGLDASDRRVAFGDYKEESGYRGMSTLLEKNPDLTAVFVASAKMTYGALKAIMDRGLKVPQDISIVGFDVHDRTGLIRPGITTILQNEEQIGRLCVELLMKGSQSDQRSDGAHSQRILLEPRLLLRESCGPPPVAVDRRIR